MAILIGSWEVKLRHPESGLFRAAQHAPRDISKSRYTHQRHRPRQLSLEDVQDVFNTFLSVPCQTPQRGSSNQTQIRSQCQRFEDVATMCDAAVEDHSCVGAAVEAPSTTMTS